ncbi:hypothetical protein ABL840_35820 [Variovorax sp. NFACC27]|uniref:Lipoprotein n=1 Tax=Variovorax gossypii TaxID=1679495 RepID=A0A3S0J4M6_9BURK|nr:hypothetical protein [Variovorax gossypii]SEF32932.1 hypothetical protein SAMN03159371_06175 [Variovorax sp. NFACC28]SEG95416.1 hypothetical protein SAMN03159365_06253 [Variovorax sp. NFACC29]SFD77007.1 hypothetical protein SAMN03159379_06212 [Variovorax sp. NFACC26]SFG91837.1 hypothetical protein SAMN03159447_05555 [Variovorax sp. NFACC27]RTQ30934.1 hypothetical protein EJP69_28335 [Variovorax gossypii]
MPPAVVLSSRLVLAAAALLAACSPAFNWREVPIAGAGLVAMLPCKADRATRALPLGSESVQVDMTGCEAGGATFAIAHASAGSPAQAEAWLHAWQAATRSQLGAAQVAESRPSVQRATAVPAPLQLDALPQPQQQPQGAATQLQVLWFAQSQKDGTVALYQATVLGHPSSAEASKTFFEGLRLP